MACTRRRALTRISDSTKHSGATDVGLPSGYPTMTVPGARKTWALSSGLLEDDARGPMKKPTTDQEAVELTISVNLVGYILPRPSLLYKGWEGRRSDQDTRDTSELEFSAIAIASSTPLEIAIVTSTNINNRQAGSRVLSFGSLNQGKLASLVSRRSHQHSKLSPQSTWGHSTLGLAGLPVC